MSQRSSGPRDGTRHRSHRPLAIVLASLVVIALVSTALAGAWTMLTGTPQGQRLTGGPIVVPQELRRVLVRAAARCEAIPVEVLAAQIAAESHWDAEAVSPAGARGIAQFMPEVWKQYGIDANKDGVANVWDPVDAIHSAAALNCINRRLVRDVPGNRLHNTIAAYNAGFGSVQKYEGVPPFPETQAYLDRILRYAETIVISDEDATSSAASRLGAGRLPKDLPKDGISLSVAS